MKKLIETRQLLVILVSFVIVGQALAFAGLNGPSPIPNPPNFYISSNAVGVCRGQVNYIPITVVNKGSATSPNAQMQNVQLSAVNTKSIYSVKNSTVTIGNLGVNSSSTVYLPVFVAANASSLISAGISINYYYFSLYSDSETRNMSFGVQTCAMQLSVAAHPEVVVAGLIQNITLDLTNLGNTTLSSLSIHAAVPGQDASILTNQPTQISSIPPKGTASVNENVFVYRNASLSFPINLSISLYNGTNLQQISDSLSLLSAGIINITPSSITLSPQNPTPGSIFSISFVLTDVGTAGASAVYATALNTGGFVPYGSNSVFVGDMQVDTQTPVTLTLTAQSSVKSGTYIIPIKLSYLNGLRQNLTSTIDVPVSIVAAAATSNTISTYRHSSSGIGLLVLVLVIVAIVLAVLFLRERKKRKAK